MRIICFDFDNTLYIGSVWGNLKQYMIDSLSKFIEKNIAQRIVEESIEITGSIHSDVIAELVEKYGYDSQRYVDHMNEDIYIHTGEVEPISNEFLRDLSKKYPIYLVSMSDKVYINYYFEKYNIDKKCFKEIVTTNLVAKDKTKMPNLKKIIEKEKIKSSELLMVGDSNVYDIEPAKKIGAQTLRFDEKNFDQIYDYFTENSILDCEKYKKCTVNC